MQFSLEVSVAPAVKKCALQICIMWISLKVSWSALQLGITHSLVMPAGYFEWQCVTSLKEPLVSARYAHSSFFHKSKV